MLTKYNMELMRVLLENHLNNKPLRGTDRYACADMINLLTKEIETKCSKISHDMAILNGWAKCPNCEVQLTEKGE